MGNRTVVPIVSCLAALGIFAALLQGGDTVPSITQANSTAEFASAGGEEHARGYRRPVAPARSKGRAELAELFSSSAPSARLEAPVPDYAPLVDQLREVDDPIIF